MIYAAVELAAKSDATNGMPEPAGRAKPMGFIGGNTGYPMDDHCKG